MSFADFKLIGLNRFPTSLYMWGDNTNGLLGDNRTPNYFSWSKISSGGLHTVAIRSDGLLFAWGRNTEGQLGDTTTIHRSSPVQLSATLSWNSVSAGLSHTVAIKSDSTLWVWGANRYGQLGDGTTVSKSSWVQVGTSSWSAVSAGGNHTTAINANTTVYAWGLNNSGQLGDGTLVSKSSPVLVGTNTTTLTNANAYSVSFTPTGAYLQFNGAAVNGLSSGTTGDYTIEAWVYLNATPVGTSYNGGAFAIVAAGNGGGSLNAIYSITVSGYLFLTRDGASYVNLTATIPTLNTWTHLAFVNVGTTMTVYLNGVSVGTTSLTGTWSVANAFTGVGGQPPSTSINGYISNLRMVKNQALYTSSPFTPSTSPLTTTSQGVTASNVMLLTAQNNPIVDNSSNAYATTIAGTTVSSLNTPFAGVFPTGAVLGLAVSAGKTHTVALTTDNKLYAWGDNTYGELGDSTTINRSSPVQIGTSSWSQISAGGTHTAGINTTGSLLTWGYNNYGQLGLNTPYSGSYWTKVSEGLTHTLAIRNDGALFVWGRNQLGQLGLGDTVARSSPVQLGTSSWTSVDAGSSHSVAVRSDGKLFTWGSNDWGQLGNNLSVNVVSINIAWSKVVASAEGPGQHMMALRNDGTLWAWGLNSAGQLGLGDTFNRISPTQIGSLSTWIDVAAADSHSVAIQADGVLYAWGLNGSGQLGDLTSASKSNPVQIGYNFKNIYSCNATNVAIDNNNYAYTWGLNSAGQLGFNDTNSRSSPTLLNTSTWNSFSIGSHVMGIKTDGSLWSWGLGTSGQLGLGDLLSRSSPTQVGTSRWIQVSAGSLFSVGITYDNSLYAWGINTNGQLGLSDTVIRSSPTVVGTVAGFESSPDSYSAKFTRSSSQYLSLDNNASMNIGTSNFTIEGWIRSSSLTSNGNAIITAANAPTNTFAFALINGATGDWQLNIGNGTSWSITGISIWTDVLNTWKHFAISRTGGILYAFVDGVLVYSVANSTNIPTNYFQIGAQTRNNRYFDGYMSTIRVIIGTGIYNTGFTPSSVPLTSISNTVLLTLQNTTIVDNSGLSQTITNNAGVTAGFVLSPFSATAITAGSTIASQVIAGTAHTLMLDSVGNLYTWGLNTSGQLGDTTVVARSSPVQVGTKSFISIIPGSSFASAIDTNGALFVWGANNLGQLGDGTTISKSSPVQIGTTLANQSSPVQIGNSSYTIVSAGEGHTLSLASDGILYGWGKNDQGQIGGQLNTLGIGWSKVVIGPTHSLGIRFDGTLYAWGTNASGQLGDRTTVAKSSPVVIDSANNWKDIAVGQAAQPFSLAIRTDGKLYAWGNNQGGQLGWISWRQISVGSGHSLLLRSDGALYTMGTNTAGQLGDPTFGVTNRSSPVQIGTSSWSVISAGVSTSAAIDTRGRLFTWGFNNVGQLGLATTANRSSPVQVSSGSWSQVSANNYMLAITTQGSIWSWGTNTNGQLGLGTTVNSKVPKLLDGNTTSYSIGFDGIGDYLTIPSNAAFAFGTGAFTVEAWVYVTGSLSTNPSIVEGTINGFGLDFNAGALAIAQTNVSFILTDPVAFSTAQWVHVAASRTGTTLRLFKNGSIVASSASNSTNFAQSTTNYFGSAQGVAFFPGYISNLRIVKGQALYTGTFTPTTSPLTTSSQGISSGTVSLLTAQNATIIDNSTANSGVGFTITSVGTPTITQYNPFSIISSTSSTSWTQVSAGTNSLAIRNDSTLYSWGQNNYGQLGDSTTINKSSPIQISASSWTLISTSMTGHSLGIEIDGSLFAWGRNTYGELGLNNEFISVSSPVQIGANSYTSISAGNNNSLALALSGTNNVLYGWGLNDSNQLNNIAAFSWRSVQSIAGIQASIGSTVGKLYLWGDNTYGQLGDNTLAARSSPTQLGGFSGSAGYKEVITTPLNTMILLSDNSLLMMGDNTYGQLGQGDTISRSSPVQVGSVGAWSAVTISGTGHVLAISISGVLFAWGNNQYNELGQSDLVVANRSSPVSVGNNANWTKVSAGNNYSLAIIDTGALYTWGRNDWGQLGTSVPLSFTNIGTGIASRNDGKLYTWGQNTTYGQVGDGTSINRSAPVQISGVTLASISWTQVSGSINNRASIRINSTLWAWGDNTYGQLGQVDNIPRSNPVQIGISSWTQVYVNVDNIFAIRSDGKLFSWGNNNVGQLGTGDTVNYSSPVQIGANSWTQIIASPTGHTLGLQADGTLYAWGNNQYNELGQNQRVQTNYSSPIQVGTSSWTKIGAGNNNSFAIRVGGSLFGWGRNEYGQIGTNNNTPLSWTQVAGGDSYSVAIRSDGKLFSWGLNNKGQLGLSDTFARSKPTQITTTSNYNYYSTLFGVGDYLQLPVSTTAFQFLANDFTIECWVYLNSNVTVANRMIWYNYPTTFAADCIFFGGHASYNGQFTFWVYNSSASAPLLLDPAVLYPFRWYHLAVVRSGNNFTMYKNGVSVATATYSGTVVSNTYVIGGYIGTSGATSLDGYMSNLRIVKGTPVYTGNFTPPTSPLTAISNTALLTCQNDRFVDNSTNNLTLIPFVNVATTASVQPFPYNIPNYSWTQVSATLSHTVAIRNDGTLWAWGANNGGQLGQGDTINRSTPVQIGSSSWIAVGVGNDASFAIRTGSGLFGWGDNTNGILGQGNTTSLSSPLQIGTSSWTSISATQHAVGITTANTMFAWGLNSAGQLGDNTTVNKSSPIQVQAGFPSSFFVYNSATVVDNSGNSVTMTATGSPTVGSTVIPFSSTFSVNFPSNTYYTTGSLPALGTQYTFEFWFYITTVNNGEWYWFDTSASVPMFYFNGNGTVITEIRKVNNGGAGNFGATGLSVAANTWHHVSYTRNSVNLMTIWLNGSSIATSSDSSNYTGGATRLGYKQGGAAGASSGYLSNFRFVNNMCLYTNTFTPSTIPLTSIGLTSSLNYTKSSAGNSHSVAIRSDSGLYTWGNNAQGQLGNSLTANRSFAIQIGVSSWTQVNAGASWTAAVTTAGGLFTWGTGANGELGAGTTLARSAPVQVGALTTWGVLSGKTHELSITTAGALFTWGTNTAGQLGDNTVVVKSSPVGVAALTNLVLDNVSSPTQIGSSSWTQVAAGDLYAVGINTIGQLFTWGYGINGRLGSGATTSRSAPVQVAGSSWLAVSTGGTENTVALTIAYTLFSWGRNNVGQIGDASIVDKSAPVAVGAALNLNLSTDIIKTVAQIGASSWSQVSAGDFHVYALRSDSGLFSWGKNDVGQLGASDVVSRSSPVQIGASTWSVISAGYSFGAAITSVGNLQTTGLNDKGQLGTSTTTNRGNFAGIGSSSWTAVSAGSSSMIGTTLSNITFVWGTNTSGQLGLVDTANRSSPVQLGSSLATSMYQTVYPSPTIVTTYSNTSWTQVNVGNSFAVGIDNAGRLFAWGLNSTGQLGDGTTINTMPTKSSPSQIATTASSFTFINTSSPVQVNAGTSWNAIAAGGTHVVAVKSDNTLWSWGVNTFGQVGNGSTIAQYIPKQVDVQNSFTSVAAGNDFSAAINTNYTLWKWGYNSSTDVTSPHRSNALQIGSDSWSVISAGGNTAAIINTVGVLYGWGKVTTIDGFAFNLGISPITWAIGSSFTNVNAGDSFIHALDSSYGLWAFGLNSTGQLGDNTVTTRSSAVQIGSLYSWSIVGGGIGGTPIGAGSLFLTGLNTSGQLGLSDAANRSSPVQLPATTQPLFNFPVRIGISRWTAISAGYSHSMAIRDDNTLWGWGLNASGQVGDTSVISRSSPVQVGASSWIAISAGKDHTGGVRLDNTLWTWGLNTRGQLGDNTTTNRNSPVQVGTGYWNNVSVGNSHTTALADNNTLYVWGDDNFGQ